MNTKNIKTLVEIMEGSSLTVLEIEEADCKIHLEKAGNQVITTVAAAPMMAASAAVPAAPVQDAPAAAAQTAPAAPQLTENTKEIKAPMVGVFYASSAPDAEPYVSVGAKVKKGQVICIIEAMKLMNEVTAELDGEVVEICAENGQIVEYGQTLMRLV